MSLRDVAVGAPLFPALKQIALDSGKAVGLGIIGPGATNMSQGVSQSAQKPN